MHLGVHKRAKCHMIMMSSFLLLTLMELSWASQMGKQMMMGSQGEVEHSKVKVGKEHSTNKEQEELDWALDQLPHHRTKRCSKA